MLPRGDYDEKRDFRRMTIECAIHYQRVDSAARHAAMARDLSATGLQMVSQQPLTPGEQITIEIAPARAVVAPLHAECEVKRVTQIDSGDWLIGLQILRHLPSTG
jgi:hypothetical protein